MTREAPQFSGLRFRGLREEECGGRPPRGSPLHCQAGRASQSLR